MLNKAAINFLIYDTDLEDYYKTYKCSIVPHTSQILNKKIATIIMHLVLR